MVHCLFERSNTFRDAFHRAGYTAISYDIEKEADIIVDIFREIENWQLERSSIFDKMKENEIVIAFFPCTYFSTQNNLNSCGVSEGMKNWNVLQKTNYAIKLAKKRVEYFTYLNILIQIAYTKNLKLIVENPAHDNYINRYLPRVYEKIEIRNRAKYGDKFKKPTMFLFFNCEPEFNLLQENDKKIEKRLYNTYGFERSRIETEFANFFIQSFIPRP